MAKSKKPAKAQAKKKRSVAAWFQQVLLTGNKRDPFRLEEDKIDKIHPEEAKFYLELAEKQLQDSVDTGQIITERATNMLNLTSALLIALVAYSIDRWETNHKWDLLLTMAVWGNAVLAFASILLIAAILPKDYCIPGWSPLKIFESKSFNEGADDNTRQKNITLNLIMNYEGDIKENNALNSKRWALFNISMFIILLAPIIFAVYYLLLR